MGATAGMLLTGGSAVEQAQALHAQARAVRSASDFDTRLADLTAGDVTSRGNFEANRRALAGRQLAGTQLAGEAAGGIDPSSGTPVGVRADTAAFSALDEQMIRNNAAREAWGYKAQAALTAAGAQNEAANLEGQAGSTLLTGAVNTYGIYADKRAGRSYGGRFRVPAAPPGGYNVFKK